MSGLLDFPDFVKSLPEIDISFPGCRGYLLQGPTQQAVFIGFDRTTKVPEHVHDEQWELVLAGEVVLDRDGAKRTFRAGDNFLVGAGVPHSAVVSAGYRAMMVFNSPDRYHRKGE